VPTQRHGVACCALDDLVVADSVNSGVVVLSVDLDVLVSCRYRPLSGVAMHDGIVFAMDDRGQRAVRRDPCRGAVMYGGCRVTVMYRDRPHSCSCRDTNA
jgi:hypothetical protein